MAPLTLQRPPASVVETPPRCRRHCTTSPEVVPAYTLPLSACNPTELRRTRNGQKRPGPGISCVRIIMVEAALLLGTDPSVQPGIMSSAKPAAASPTPTYVPSHRDIPQGVPWRMTQ